MTKYGWMVAAVALAVCAACVGTMQERASTVLDATCRICETVETVCRVRRAMGQTSVAGAPGLASTGAGGAQ